MWTRRKTPTARDTGALGERLAARYLRRRFYRILAQNRHFGHNELDLVARKGDYIAFVEVKTRTVKDMAELDATRPSLAVDMGKRRRTIAAARRYLAAYPTALCPRMDVIEVYLTRTEKPKVLKIHHIKGAFDAFGRVL